MPNAHYSIPRWLIVLFVPDPNFPQRSLLWIAGWTRNQAYSKREPHPHGVTYLEVGQREAREHLFSLSNEKYIRESAVLIICKVIWISKAKVCILWALGTISQPRWLTSTKYRILDPAGVFPLELPGHWNLSFFIFLSLTIAFVLGYGLHMGCSCSFMPRCRSPMLKLSWRYSSNS